MAQVAGASGFPHAQSMGLVKLVKSVTKVDDNTVKFVLNEPNATFVPILTMGFASIYSAEYADQLLKAGKQADLNGKPVGTGPFVLKSYTKDALIRYDVNPTYWGTKPKVDRLIYAITPDPSVRQQKVKAGECQIALSPKPQDVLAAKGEKRTEGRADACVHDRVRCTEHAEETARQRQGARGAEPRVRPRDLPESRVRQHRDGREQPVSAEHVELREGRRAVCIRSGEGEAAARAGRLPERLLDDDLDAPDRQRAEPEPEGRRGAVAGRLAKIGVKAEVKVIEWGELIKQAKLGQHDMLFMGWAGDNGDPDNYLSPLFSCNAVKSGINFARFCDTQLDKLIADGKSTADPSARSCTKPRRRSSTTRRWIPLGYPTAAALTRTNVSGYHVSPFGRQNFTTVAVQ